MNEQEIIRRLEAKGYSVELFNEKGTAFNEKYVVYQKFESPMGFGNSVPQNKIVIVDAEGNVVGAQG